MAKPTKRQVRQQVVKVNKEIGRMLVAVRRYMGYSVLDFANLAGITKEELTKLQAGSTDVHQINYTMAMVAVAAILDYDPELLINYDPELLAGHQKEPTSTPKRTTKKAHQ